MTKFSRSPRAITVDLYAEVTNQIIAALEAGAHPWACPWDRQHGSLMPANLTSGRHYRGINILLLNLRQIAGGYPTHRWLTFQQAHSVGAHVRRGESGTRIVFFKLLERDDVAGAFEELVPAGTCSVGSAAALGRRTAPGLTDPVPAVHLDRAAPGSNEPHYRPVSAFLKEITMPQAIESENYFTRLSAINVNEMPFSNT